MALNEMFHRFYRLSYGIRTPKRLNRCTFCSNRNSICYNQFVNASLDIVKKGGSKTEEGGWTEAVTSRQKG